MLPTKHSRLSCNFVLIKLNRNSKKFLRASFRGDTLIFVSLSLTLTSGGANKPAYVAVQF